MVCVPPLAGLSYFKEHCEFFISLLLSFEVLREVSPVNKIIQSVALHVTLICCLSAVVALNWLFTAVSVTAHLAYWLPNERHFHMAVLHRILVEPPLLNSACAWASDLNQLTELYDCPFTGAVTTRTATKGGFKEDVTHMVSLLWH
jgi:hypothetical protein